MMKRTTMAGLLLVLVTAAPVPAAPVWRSASPGRLLSFPADHASHPDYKTEWWYYTGHLQGTGERRYGYELTFFREGMRQAADPRSRWSLDQVYLAHFAVTDLTEGRFRYSERLNRGGLGVAGARTDRYEVWNDGWQARAIGDKHRLKAAGKGFAIDLLLSPRKPPVLHGDRGFSRKGDCDSCASHYYSLTRLQTQGVLTIDGHAIPVQGLSWMDHEFSSSMLQRHQTGWDWFSLQFDDGSELMLFHVRRQDGTIEPHSSGTWIPAKGKPIHLEREALAVTPTGSWRSPATGARYPQDWRIAVPRLGLNLTVKSLLADQELRTDNSTKITYWEGAVAVTGTRNGQATKGQGYVELTGYDKAFDVDI